MQSSKTGTHVSSLFLIADDRDWCIYGAERVWAKQHTDPRSDAWATAPTTQAGFLQENI